MTNITFITGNPSKAEQLSWYLNIPVAHRKPDLPEIQSLDLREVVAHKAQEAYKHVNAPVLVEDTSLIFNALGNLPGPFIKWFLQELNNQGLCTLLNTGADRTAIAQVLFGYYDGTALSLFEGHIKGSIAQAPRGQRGFGWDPVFIPEGYNKTWGEMDVDEQAQTSMRRIALKKIEDFLNQKTLV